MAPGKLPVNEDYDLQWSGMNQNLDKCWPNRGNI